MTWRMTMKPSELDERIASISRSIDPDEVVSLAQELVRIPSKYREEHKVAGHISKKLASWGFEPQLVPVEGFGPCVVCQHGTGHKRSVILNGHMDTVEIKEGWKHDPFGAKIEKGMMYGLGSLDMKSGLAALMIAFRTAAESGQDLNCNVRFQGVTGEEENSAGIRTLISEGYFKDVKATIVGEGIGGMGVITHGRRGGSYYNIDVTGRSVHGSTPNLGVNAIEDAAKIVTALDKMKMRAAPGLVSDSGQELRESQVVLRIHGGDVSYSVPDKCSIRMMRATVPGHPIDITAELRKIVKGLRLRSSVKITLQRGEGDLLKPYFSPKESELVNTTSKWIIHYTGKDPRLVCGLSEADDNKIAELARVPVICFGPGERGKLARYHQAEEAVGVAQLGVAARIYCSTVIELASAP
jgi:acetylornithine deacetylase/succinyl-diaminopimelate desuccinylase family protein